MYTSSAETSPFQSRKLLTCCPETGSGFIPTCPKARPRTSFWSSPFCVDPPTRRRRSGLPGLKPGPAKPTTKASLSSCPPKRSRPCFFWRLRPAATSIPCARPCAAEPGSFVRAAQDLQAASWERMRLEAYLSDIEDTSQFDPAALKTRTEMAARSLGIKINEAAS